ncbi:hypothetical protein Cpir12675_002532 [Ceratocystis pirilliformis]|uniref:Uncharacterized protein n=1 Tax=Ceratocystis pirilliformis TaxID=259994 RepID=A0ABR3Z9S4_9PEZI
MEIDRRDIWLDYPKARLSELCDKVSAVLPAFETFRPYIRAALAFTRPPNKTVNDGFLGLDRLLEILPLRKEEREAREMYCKIARAAAVEGSLRLTGRLEKAASQHRNLKSSQPIVLKQTASKRLALRYLRDDFYAKMQAIEEESKKNAAKEPHIGGPARSNHFINRIALSMVVEDPLTAIDNAATATAAAAKPKSVLSRGPCRVAGAPKSVQFGPRAFRTIPTREEEGNTEITYSVACPGYDFPEYLEEIFEFEQIQVDRPYRQQPAANRSGDNQSQEPQAESVQLNSSENQVNHATMSDD